MSPVVNLRNGDGADVTGALCSAGRRMKGGPLLESMVGFPLCTADGLLENCFRVSKKLWLSYKKRKSRLLSRVCFIFRRLIDR